MADYDTYQWRLRALGAFLDTQFAAEVTIIEARPRFAVRYYRRRDEGDPIFVLVESAQLRAITEALKQRRRSLFDDAPTAQHPGPITADDRYQDLFRALGWELDDLKGSNVVIDEREDGLYIAYAYRDPATGKTTRKRVANLGPVEREAILTDARRRRRHL
jgi:hypothetical protein